MLYCINSSCLFTPEQYSIIWTYHNYFILSLINLHLDCFKFGAVINKVAMYIDIQLSLNKTSFFLYKY